MGDPAEPERVESVIAGWPGELAGGSAELVMAIARQAERLGCWSSASSAWERLARRYEGPPLADHLARAAIDAGVAGDLDRREELLNAAEAEHPSGVRARLERLDDHAEPEEQLAELAQLQTDDEPLASLIAAHMARASMLIPDLKSAEAHLQEAARLEPGSVTVRTMQVNLRVQRARLALRDDRDFSLIEARQAAEEALELRQSLLSMRRFEESGRLLMLAADVHAVQRDPRSAAQVLAAATEDEIRAPDGAEVLGDAALRTGDHHLALRFTENVRPNDGVRRIRATAKVDVGGRDRIEGLTVLEELALEGGPRSGAGGARQAGGVPSPYPGPVE